MATITKTIGTNARDYSTMTLWEADLDSGGIYSSGDAAIGACYNDSVFNEDLLIDGGSTVGLIAITLTAAGGQQHNGTARTGARNTVDHTGMDVLSTVPTTVEKLEVYFDDGPSATGPFMVQMHIGAHRAQQLIVHSAPAGSGLVGLGVDSTNALNCIVYNMVSDSAGGIILQSGSGKVINCTLFRIRGDSSVKGISAGSGPVCRNCICVDVAPLSMSGTPECFYGPSATMDHNLSSDATASGTGSIDNTQAGALFISTVQGGESLLLRNNAPCIGKGADLGTSPAGVNVDITGYDRDATGVTWDIGADQHQDNAKFLTTCISGGCPRGALTQVSSSGTCAAQSSNSVILSSGAFTFGLPLLSIDSLGGLGWGFDLNYLSSNGLDGMTGLGFNFPQNLRLEELLSGDVELLSGDNGQDLFIENAGDYVPAVNNNTQATLTRAGSGASDEFTLTASDGTVTKFFGFDGALDTPGRIKSITDRHGSQQTYVWTVTSGMDQLTSVTDSYGRTVEYRYYGSGDGYRLREIEDFLGRKLNFQYDAGGRLVAVVTPSILRGAGDNTYPGGTAYVFEYDTENADPNRQNDLIRIWYPNQTAPYLNTATRTVDVDDVYTEATPRYFVEYGQDDNDPGTYGRVIEETVGDPGNVVGGTYEYAYATAGLPDNLVDPNDPISLRCTMTDRNGNVTIYDFNAAEMPVRVEVQRNRSKIDLPPDAAGGGFDSFITWTKYNANNQPVLVIHPEGNSVEFAYDDGMVDLGSGEVLYNGRLGLLTRETRKVDNPLKLESVDAISARRDAPSNGQSELTRRFFYEPIFNQQTAVIEERGNPIAADFQVWGAVALLDGLSPNGSFYESGTQGGQPAYVHADGRFWLWYNGSTEWHISRVKGTDGSGHWEKATSAKGSYSAEGTASGSLVVSAADYFVTGSGFEDADGTMPTGQYYEDGTQGGQPAYRRADSAWWLWYDSGNTEWHISKVKGTNGDAYFDNGSPTITDAPYSAAGADGARTLTVSANGGSAYFTPQNGGSAPTDADRSRYATVTYRDYQKNELTTISDDAELQALLGLSDTQIEALIGHVDDQMKATDGTGGLPAGFEVDLGDINGDGTGDGDSSGLEAAPHLGNLVKVVHPLVRLIGSSAITTQEREEIFTVNAKGQTTTHTDAEGNLTVYVRYPENDPEGDGKFVSTTLSGKQYGRMREIHADADPDDVMSLLGEDGDLADFVSGIIARSNTPGVYQDLVTRYEGDTFGTGSCTSCAYDALGNPLSETDPRGFTRHYQRNEMGEVFRTIGPAPYEYQTETYYDANRNVIRVDAQDTAVDFDSEDPSDADYAHFVPSGSDGVANVPSRGRVGGSVRTGWFTSLTDYDLLDNRIEEDVDATGSHPDSLVTTYQYDANQNVVQIVRPDGNTVKFNYDERNLQIATRSGDSPETPADTVTVYDGNGNVIQVIGPAARGATDNRQTVTIDDAFGSASTLTHNGDWLVENTLDGFDRTIFSTDATGNVVETSFDPSGRAIENTRRGPLGAATPTDRKGTGNVEQGISTMRYDEAGRQYESQEEVFVALGTVGSAEITHVGGGLEANSVDDDHTATYTLTDGSDEGLGPVAGSYVLSRTVHDRAGRVVEAIADNAVVSQSEYDGAGRRIIERDPLGNEVDYDHDPNGNVILVTRYEECTIDTHEIPTEVFQSAMRYDSLNRLVARLEANPAGEAA
ncbi:MAG: hypothetical protein K8T91_03255 [Planctomycetes bacterium]|nr:hypothetical protein [Planctomycetota bacterium]